MDKTKNNLLDELSKLPQLLVFINTFFTFYLRYIYSKDAELFYNIPDNYFYTSANNKKIIVILIISFSLLLPLFFDKYLYVNISKEKQNTINRTIVITFGMFSFLFMYNNLHFVKTIILCSFFTIIYKKSVFFLKNENLGINEEYKNKTYIMIILFLLINFFTLMLGREKPNTLKNYEVLFQINNSSEVTSNYKKDSYLIKVGEYNDKFIVLSGKIKSQSLTLDTSAYGFVNPEKYFVKNRRFKEVKAVNKDEK